MLRETRARSKTGERRQIFSVGGHAFLNWPLSSAAAVANPVLPVTDLHGVLLANDFADGERVEILAWRPRSREGLRYQVRRLADGREGWVDAQHLRGQAVAAPIAG